MEKLQFDGSGGTVRIPLPKGKWAELIWKQEGDSTTVRICLAYGQVYGLGEKFNGINQKGNKVLNQVEEKFCYQGEKTYCPIPFFFTDSGFGFFADTREASVFDFQEEIVCKIPKKCTVYCFNGNPKEIIAEYMKLSGQAKLPPSYAFGPWISANHWDSGHKTLQQIKLLEQYEYPATVLVLEAWSDEATFYIFNEAEYEPRADGRFCAQDFRYPPDGKWKDPKEMIEKLHRKGLHLILWQIPVYKKQGKEEVNNRQNELDKQEAIARRLCVMKADGTPYMIPEGNWFAGSCIPDFTREETRKAWFLRRKYLLDIGVDGFKTDGGEFIYSDDVVFADGAGGKEAKNRYAMEYLKAYTEFLGKDHVLFSRAGYSGAHTVPIHWAGDHQSDNEEFKSTLSAGLSAALSGIIFWGFDIAGFAGSLPTIDLYRRATQMACFCPVMQWHSEPDGGQFKELMPGGEGNNERSPWNMEAAYESSGFTEEMRFWHWLRMNLLPYLYDTAIQCVKENSPMMYPLVYEWNNERQAVETEDEYGLGKALLVAPLMEENQTSREVYLPEENWFGFFSHRKYCGGKTISSEGEKFPVYIREHHGVALFVEGSKELGEPMKTGKEADTHLHFLLAGETGSCCLEDEKGVITLKWQGSKVEMNNEREEDITWEIIK